MSRLASNGTRSVLGPEDQCPICKTSRYANKTLQFLINAECYHPMCRNCVERIFKDAPAQCPTAGCPKTLRFKGFRPVFFSDLAVERDVDVRRRVASVFNRSEDEFETLKDYNNYLQDVEDLIFDLLNGTESERVMAERKLEQYQEAHKAEIERNQRRGNYAAKVAADREKAEREAAYQRRLKEALEIENERLQRARDREDELDQLAKAPEGRVQLKKRTARNVPIKQPGAAATVDGKDWASASAGMGRMSLHGLKKEKRPPAPQGPYDPFGGLDLTPTRYQIHDGLVNPWKNDARLHSTILTGGYSFEEYTARAMFEAFAGLGVFVEDEKDDVPTGSGGVPKVKHEFDTVVKMEVDSGVS